MPHRIFTKDYNLKQTACISCFT